MPRDPAADGGTRIGGATATAIAEGRCAMIEVRSLVKKYGDTTAVQDLSFRVEAGRVTGFLGPNGAGKSTTMRMILGLDRPTAGVALINGKPYRDLRYPLHTVGALLDAHWVHPNRSAAAHLEWIARSNKLSRRRVETVLDLVGLTAVANRRAGAFSLGMSQRLGIAAALLGDPEILMFDEPVNGLDPEGILWIRHFMQDRAAEGRTVFVSSHLLSEMALTASHLIVIGRGKLIAQASTDDFVAGASESTVHVRTPEPDRFVQLLQDNGIRVHRISGALQVSGESTDRLAVLAHEADILLLELARQNASLEEAFMHVTGHDVEYAGPGGTKSVSGPAELATVGGGRS